MTEIQKIFEANKLSFMVWAADWKGGEWSLQFHFFGPEVKELADIGVTEDFIKWLYEQNLYESRQIISNFDVVETREEAYYFAATPENLKRFQEGKLL